MGILGKLFGPPNIERLKERRDIDSLIRASFHKESSTRRDAVEGLL